MLNAMLLDSGTQPNAVPYIFVTPKVAMAEPKKKETEAKFAYDLVRGGGSDSNIAAVVYKIGRDPWCVKLDLELDFEKERSDVYVLMVSEAKVVLKRPNSNQLHETIFNEKRKPRPKTIEKLKEAIRQDNEPEFNSGELKFG